jgi:transcription elongation factor GreA
MKGAQKLRDELDHLKSVKRPKVIAAIAEAREHGDLKENAEYHAAREEQGFIEGRIKQLEGELSHAEIIDVSKLNAGSKVVFGASVTWPTWKPTKRRSTRSSVTWKRTSSWA